MIFSSCLRNCNRGGIANDSGRIYIPTIFNNFTNILRIFNNTMNNERDIIDTLTERGNRYGKFINHAKLTQEIKAVMWNHDGWEGLDDDMKEALEMIAHKIGRILSGDPHYDDTWHDIAGYAKLIEDRINGVER